MHMKIPKILVSLAVVSVLVGGIYGARYARGLDAKSVSAPMLAAPRAMGNPAAKTRVVEFIDYQCPSCAKSSKFLHELVKLHPQEIYLEVKYFPLKGHAHSMTTAKLVECSRMQGKFWEAHHAVFLSQSAWRDLEDATPVLSLAVQAAGVDVAAIDRCAQDPAVEQRILAERDEALKLGLRSTPTFYINGTMVVGFLGMQAEMVKIFPDAADIPLPADNASTTPPSARGPLSAVKKADGSIELTGASGKANGS
jgi:protein-disulfide isomerase